MIGGNCGNCVFFDKDKIKCNHDQFFISTGKGSYAPGFCRLWRSQKWSKNKKENLIQLSRKESELNYSLIIIHNNDDHLKILENNLSYSYCPALSSTNKFNNPLRQIIIADTTNKKDRSQIINLFKNHKDIVKLDILIDNQEEKTANTIKRISCLVNHKYFIVVPSSKIISGRDNEIMINEINNKDTRFIFWPFINRLAQTIILPLQPFYGLYIKDSYNKLTQLTENPATFYENLKKEELSTGISLSCPIDVTI